MPIYYIVEKVALFIALATCALFLTFHEVEAAVAALALWPLTRAAISVVDVFVVFFTEEPMVRRSAGKQVLGDALISNTSD